GTTCCRRYGADGSCRIRHSPRAINAARRAIDDNGAAQRWMRTLPRKGVRFIGAAHEEPAPASASSPPPRLSIIVLPFLNLSSDPEQHYFADGITDDLTTDLSRIAGMLVISRNTAFTYKDKPVDTRQIGRELGVRYVLEGRPTVGKPSPHQRPAD